MKNVKIALIGGDLRFAALVEYFLEKGLDTVCFGIDKEYLPRGAESAKSEGEALKNADAVVLPLPASGDGISVSCPLKKNGEEILIREIFKLAKDIPIYAGRLSPQMKKLAAEEEVDITDYFDLEELKIRNSVLASEGALSLAMNRLDVSIFGSKCAVVGYGRLGKTLAPMLKALGASVTVAARKSADIAWASAYGFDTVRISYDGGEPSLKKLSDGYDAIFNTVPCWIIDESVLSCMPSKTVILDLASAPGGVDPRLAEKYGREVIPALSLPGKYAPISAGKLIGEYLFERLARDPGL